VGLKKTPLFSLVGAREGSFLVPKSSDSRRVSVMAAQLIFTKGASFVAVEMDAPAIISFPVPDSR